MTINNWLQASTKKLEQKNILSAHLDCLIILELVLKIDRTKILAKLDTKLSLKHILLLKRYLHTRSNQVPIAYLTKNIEFYGRDFYVDKRVLIPRPESELIIEIVKYLTINLQNILSHKSLPFKADPLLKLPPIEYKTINKYFKQVPLNSDIQLADLGCGSGNLGISITLELPKVTVDLIDNSPLALQVTKINVAKYSTSNLIIRSNLLDNISKDYHIIVANLPYVPDDYPVSNSIKFEPKNAIFAGSDGLKYYQELFKQLRNIKNKPLYIIIEKMPILDSKLTTLTKHSDYKIISSSDYVNVYQLKL